MAVKGRQRMRLPRCDGRDTSRNRKHSTSGTELLKREMIEEGTDLDYIEYLVSIRANAKKRRLLGIRNRKRKRNTKTKSSGKRVEEDEELENILYHDDDCYYYEDDDEEEKEDEEDDDEEEEEEDDDEEEEEKNDDDEEEEEEDEDEDEDEEVEEEKADPEFLMILAGMKEDGKSYRFERVENGVRTIIKYEEPLSSDTESDELRRKLGSAQIPHLENQGMLNSYHTPSKKLKRLTWSQTRSKCTSKREGKGNFLTKRNIPVPRFTPVHHTPDSSSDEESDAEHRRTKTVTKQSKETEKLTRRGPRKKSKIEKEEDIIQMDPDYYVFNKHSKSVDGNLVFNDGNHEVVYELRIGQSSWVKQVKREDISYSDVEIFDSSAFHKMDNGCNPNQWDATGKSEFRREIIAALRKPFDREELERLYRQVKHYAAKERHLDLRNGREKSMGTQEDGKSLLDYHPVFRRKLVEAKGDERKCLNLLRGFLLWIKKSEPPLEPWTDAECLAVYPEPGSDYDDF